KIASVDHLKLAVLAKMIIKANCRSQAKAIHNDKRKRIAKRETLVRMTLQQRKRLLLVLIGWLLDADDGILPHVPDDLLAHIGSSAEDGVDFSEDKWRHRQPATILHQHF